MSDFWKILSDANAAAPEGSKVPVAYLRPYATPPKLPCRMCGQGEAESAYSEGMGWMSLGLCGPCGALDRSRQEEKERWEQERRAAAASRLKRAGYVRGLGEGLGMPETWKGLQRGEGGEGPRAGVLWGPGAKRGQTANQVLRWYVEAGWTCLAAFESDLGASLAAPVGTEGHLGTAEVESLDLLIVKTVGDVPLADWQSARVRKVLTGRLERGRPIVIDTALSPKQLAAEPSVGVANAEALFLASGEGRLVARFGAVGGWEAMG